MLTTTLFVEILVIGAIAEIWMILILFSLCSIEIIEYMHYINTIDSLSNIIIIPFLSVTYVIGWLVNFGSERIFKLFFQKRLRDKLLQKADDSYENIRLLIFQKASSNVKDELIFDRHILRISRSSVLNFIMIAIGLSIHRQHHECLIGISFCILFAGISFFQWATRYSFYYRKMTDISKTLK